MGLVESLPLLLRPKQAAKYAGVGRDKFYRKLDAGEIPVVWIDGVRYVRRLQVDQWVAELAEASGQ